MIELRPYQREAITAVAAAFKRGVRRPLVSLPTGTGKTICFATIAQGAYQKDRRVLILAHRDELLQQARDKLLMCAPELEGNVGMVKGELKDYFTPVTIASVQSLHERRLKKMLDEWAGSTGDRAIWDICIVDEAHHSGADSYKRILEAIGSFEEDTDMLTLGVTATPQRADGKNLGDVYEEVVYHRDLLSMMQEGYLCDLRGLQVTLEALDLSKLKVRGGDYVDGETSAKLLDAEAPRHVCGAWRAHASERKTIIFTPTIVLAHEMAREFAKHGVRAAALSGETPMDQRREMLRSFHEGSTQVIANAQVLTEGFDEPSVDCIVIARPTKSQVLYSQMIGRGTRPYPGKKDCLIVDTVGAANRMDLLTVPKLFGLGKEAAAGGPTTILQLAFQREQAQTRDGVVKVQEVSLFERQQFNWLAVRPGTWVLALQGESLELQVDQGSGKWMFVTRTTGPDALPNRTIRRTGMTLELAMGVAEEYARRSGSLVNTLVSKNAGWRTLEVSEKQVEAMRAWRISETTIKGVKTKGEASDLIDLAKAKRGR